MSERLISESITPSHEVAAEPLTVGEPILPARFIWRGAEHRVAEILERWHALGPCSASDERYLRRHWYRIRTDAGVEMKIYFERQARSRSQARRRWWLYSIVEGEGGM
jgi:uncharacterized protein DUF6504